MFVLGLVLIAIVVGLLFILVLVVVLGVVLVMLVPASGGVECTAEGACRCRFVEGCSTNIPAVDDLIC